MKTPSPTSKTIKYVSFDVHAETLATGIAEHRPQGTRPPATRKLSGSAGYGVPASAGGNPPGHNAPEPPGETSTGLSVKSVSLHKSASGLAHSTTLTRFTQPRARSLPLGRRCPQPRFLGRTRSRGDRGGMGSVHKGHVRKQVKMATSWGCSKALIMRRLQHST
jgi:hypothetical protein